MGNITLINAATMAENAMYRFKETHSALDLLNEMMAEEGLQAGGEFDTSQAISFAKRFPGMLYTFNVLLRDMQASVEELENDVDALYAAARNPAEVTA